MDTWLDTQLQIDYAAEVAREEGKAEGVKEGEARGKREGILSVARNLLKIGTSVKDVAGVTGMSPDELTKLSLQ